MGVFLAEELHDVDEALAEVFVEGEGFGHLRAVVFYGVAHLGDLGGGE